MIPNKPMNIDTILSDVFRHIIPLINLINAKKLTDDHVYRIFKNLCYLLNRPCCSSIDQDKMFNIVKCLFDNNYAIGLDHLSALLEKDSGPYFYYYLHKIDIVKSLELFIKNGINPQKYHISAYTSPEIIKFLYESGYDFIDSYIIKCNEKNKSRFVKDMIEYLRDRSDLYNRKEMLEILTKRKTYDNLLVS